MVKVMGQVYQEMIRAILRQRASQGLPMTVEFLTEIWGSLIGPELAEVTRPVALGQGSLQVACVTETWQQQMTGQEARLKRLLNQQLPDPLHRIEFLVGSPRLFPDHGEVTRQVPPVGSLPLAEAQLLDDIEDDELRAIMIRVRRLDRGRQG